MRIGLRAKTVALTLLCSLLPLTLIAIGSYYSARRALGEFVTSDLASISKEERRSAELIAINSDGKALAATRPENLGKELSATEAFQAVAQGKPVQASVAASDLIGGSALTFASPIVADYDSSLTIGALVGLLDWSKIEKRLATASIAGASQDEERLLVLLEGADTVLYSTVPEADLRTSGLLSHLSHRLAAGWRRSRLEGERFCTAAPCCRWAAGCRIRAGPCTRPSPRTRLSSASPS